MGKRTDCEQHPDCRYVIEVDDNPVWYLFSVFERNEKLFVKFIRAWTSPPPIILVRAPRRYKPLEKIAKRKVQGTC